MRIRDAFRDWREPGNLRRDLLKLVVLGAAAGIAVGLFLGLGLFNIAASSGHWKITDIVLHTVMRQSVKFHALGIETPPLDDMGLVQAGAGHFETGCAPCHGSPAAPRNPVALEMTPHPPDLARKVPDWEPGQLFWIVRHGVKFTGMPAWPDRRRSFEHGEGRDEEIWAVVAFLQRLPGMGAEEYGRLALGPAADPRGMEAAARLRGLSDPILPLIENCARCHGYDGKGRGSALIPRLDLQREAYLLASLRAYADATRSSGMMQLQASGLSDLEILTLAKFYAQQPAGTPDPGSSFLSADLVERGRRIALHGVPERNVPACASCHGPGRTKHNPVFPNLAGQRHEYVRRQLGLWHDEKRGGTPYAHLMEAAARNLTPEDMDSVAAYYTALSPADD